MTLTNGVSFSLVAGSVCAVVCSNAITYTTNSPTLNINSTGAKALYPAPVTSTSWSRTRWFYNHSNYIGLYKCDSAVRFISVYTGSYYIAVGSGDAPEGYYDYGD